MHTYYPFQIRMFLFEIPPAYVSTSPSQGWMVALLQDKDSVHGYKKNLIIKTKNECKQALLDSPYISVGDGQKKKKQNFCPLLFVISTVTDSKEIFMEEIFS